MSRAPEQVVALVETFQRNRSAYRSGAYKEEQLKQEFLNPLFEALGWDVSNVRKRAAPQYRDVIFEDSLKVEGGVQAPDYCFTLSGTRQFFVEAKRPSVDVQTDADAIYQLRSYAWSAKLPLSILTNFDVLAVYEPRLKPRLGDKPSAERVKVLSCEEYVDKWDEIASLFSWDAVLQGSIDRFAKDAEGRRGIQPVDDEFLAEIEAWRESLAKNLALRNASLSIHGLNDAVQKSIDRIVFLRMCEARGIERYGQLQELLKGDRVYARLGQIYRQSDEKYNSGLFHFERERDRLTPPDETTLGLSIDDAVLRDLIKNLYYPASPYQFSVIPPEILGSIYERFLGKVIRLTDGHRAKVEEKPEVKRAGGVYYTPHYIVDYIVRTTLGELCEGKTPKATEKLRVLDPSCGSGSFLLGAYTFLLGQHLKYYTAQKNPGKFTDQIYQRKGGDWALTIKEKKRILLGNIFGVDIDPQAVEVTKLSLLLKVLEGENKDVFERQQKLWRERALPDLDGNIKCGNSLVGPDFYRGGIQTTLENTSVYEINAFDWNAEFPQIISEGGFDVVIGNPPYVKQERLGDLKEYLRGKYRVFDSAADLYSYFIERGFTLLKEGGSFSYIVGNKWMRARYGGPLREWLSGINLDRLIDFGSLPVFKQATTYPCIFRIRKTPPSPTIEVTSVSTLGFRDLETYVKVNAYPVTRGSLDRRAWSLAGDESLGVMEKLRVGSKPLTEYVDGRIYYGIKTALNDAFIIDTSTRDGLLRADPKSKELLKPFLIGKDIKRYAIIDRGRSVVLIPNGWTREHGTGRGDLWDWFSRRYPAVADHLRPFESRARERDDQGEFWWELRPCAYYAEFAKPKIIWPGISREVSAFAFDDSGFYGNDNNQFIVTDDLYLLAILNSSVAKYYLKNVCDKVQGGFYRLKIIYIERIPIREVDLAKPMQVLRREKIVALVGRLLDLNRILARANSDHERAVFQRQADLVDREVDELIFEVYGLSPSEVGLVLNEARPSANLASPS